MDNQSLPDTTLVAPIIKQAINNWIGQGKIITTFFSKYPDDVYMEEIAPGRNRCIYILGHMIATNDGILPLLGKGEKLFPELEGIFLTTPDRTFETIPTIDELRQKWKALEAKLEDTFSYMEPKEWLERHTRISQEDFAKEPNRNRLSILLSRTIHTSYHAGQLALVKKEGEAG